MADPARRLQSYKHYCTGDKAASVQQCLAEKEKKPQMVPFYFSHLDSNPGFFTLSYCPTTKLVFYVFICHPMWILGLTLPFLGCGRSWWA